MVMLNGRIQNLSKQIPENKEKFQGVLKFDNIINYSHGDYTTQSYLSIATPESFATFYDSNHSELETQESMIDIKTPHTPPYPILQNTKEILIQTPKCKNKNTFKMKIPLPISPLTSPFLNDLQNGKLTENLPPDKDSLPKKNNLSPIFYNPRTATDNFSSKVQGTKFLTTNVDDRTSEKQNERFFEKETQCSNNTNIINHNILKKNDDNDKAKFPTPSYYPQ